MLCAGTSNVVAGALGAGMTGVIQPSILARSRKLLMH